MTPDVQQLAAALFDALGIKVACGSVTLNVHESRIESVETKVRLKVQKRIDFLEAPRLRLTQ